MKLSVILLVLLAACESVNVNDSPQNVNQEQETAKQTETTSTMDALDLESLGPAPELSNQVWLNTDHPLRLAELRGNVVLLEMWTFG